MAAKHFYRQGFLLLLFNFISTAALEKRFSDFKRCADEECSMLLVRGKALKDFSGPDCRFLSFKTSETIYVYYKLAGRRADIWAGSVGSNFGYFPMDLLAVNHVYTDKEIEIQAEETDFVCFDTGFDKFQNYDIDSLLGSSPEESEDKEPSDQLDIAEDTQTETQPSEDSENESQTQDEHHNISEELYEVSDVESASLSKHDVETESPSTDEVESDTAATLDATEGEAEHTEDHKVHETEESDMDETKDTTDSASKDDFVIEHVQISEERQIPKLSTNMGTNFDTNSNEEITTKVTPEEEGEERKDVVKPPVDDDDTADKEAPPLSYSEQTGNTPASESVTTSEGAQIPDLKTTLGNTFDAVVSSEEVTRNVTPYEEEEREDVESPSEDDRDAKRGTPLLSFSEDGVHTPKSHSEKTSEGVPIPKLETKFGTTFDAVVSDDKMTPYSEEKSEDEESPPEDDLKKETPLLSFSEEDQVPYSDKISQGFEIPKLKTSYGRTLDAIVSDGGITRKVTPDEEEERDNAEITPEDNKKVTPLLSYSEDTPEDTYTENISEGVQIPKIKTSFGRTLDVLVTDDSITLDTTPNEEETSDTPGDDTDHTDVQKGTPLLSLSEDTPVSYTESISEGAQIPKLKTTHGTTFDAVVTDQEVTKRVSPYEEEEREEVESPSKDHSEVKGETPLLSFSEDSVNTPGDKPEEERNMWTTIGDAVFSVVTGGERTAGDYDSDEDDEDDDEEKAVPETPQSFEDARKNIEEPVYLETPKYKKGMDEVHEELSNDNSVQPDDHDDGEVVGPQETLEDEPVDHQSETRTKSDDLVSQHDSPVNSEAETIDTNTKDELQEEDEAKYDQESVHGSSHTMEQSQFDSDTEENKMVGDHEIASTDQEKHQQPPSDFTGDDKRPRHKLWMIDPKSAPKLSEEEPELREEPLEEDLDDGKDPDAPEGKEELLEDENALSFSQSDDADSDTTSPTETESTPEPEYSDSVLRLTLLRDHFTEEKMERVQKLLGLKNLFKVEAMFTDLDTEMKATRLSHRGTTEDIESALESILEASENTILDEIEKIMDNKDTKYDYEQDMERGNIDEETEILDDFQELSFSIRQKYSTVSDSTPLAHGQTTDIDQDQPDLTAKDDQPNQTQSDSVDIIPETKSDDNLTGTDPDKRQTETLEEKLLWDGVHRRPDVSVEEDGGHFNKNKDNQQSFREQEEIQKVPQDTLENPLDMGLGVEVEHSPSGSLDSMEQVPEVSEEEVGLFSTGIVYMGCILSMTKSKIEEWTTVMISQLPEEWKPGETLYGCPWQAVVITALVGVMTFTLFFWRTVLAVKKRQYLLDEKSLSEQMRSLKKEKEDALTKMSELQKQTVELKEKEKQSKEEVTYTAKRIQDLERKVFDAETRNQKIAEEKNKYSKLLQDERANSHQNETRIEKLERSNEKLQLSRKKIQDALAKTTVLLDEAKIREDARNVQQKCLEKDFTALKEENKTLKANIKSWEEKHKELNEQIKVYQKSQKELEDSVVLKDHNVEVLSELLADLDACDSQKGDIKVLANGEVTPDKKTAIKNRIKQMMDVSRVQTTLTVVEEERDRFMTKLLNEEKGRKALEEKHQELEHAIATLKSDKSHVENQFKILQQKNEIMVEMYQQKENALQQRLTKEELERRSKENMLSEVGGKAVEAEEQVKLLRQRINEMEEQMKKTEEVYKEQVKEQENKTHSNWVNARNAERALNQEKLESSKLREKLAVLTSQLNERRAPLFRPNSGQPAGPRQGDSYGPSPVSGGAPSPPIMIEGPRRPPSAPVGRRIDPYGPRPPSDPHGRYAENKHIPGMDMMGPRSSSPANMDTSTQAVDPQIKAEKQAEASTDSPEPGPGSFMVSPIRDSPGHMAHGPPPGPGPHDQILPPGRLPPPGPYRPPPRPGPYHLPPGPHGPLPPNVPPPLHGPPLPPNGHPGVPMPGPMGGEFGPRPANGHAFHPRPGPGHMMDPRGPPPPHFRPPPPHHFGPMPPPHGIRGPMGPRPPIVPSDMRFPGPRDNTSPPMNLPPGVPPHSAHPGDAYGQAPAEALQNSEGAHSGPGQGPYGKQGAPQDSGRPAMVKP